MNQSLQSQIVSGAAKASPGAAYAGYTHIFGLQPTEWVTVLTIAYLLIQIVILIPRCASAVADAISKMRGR